ncbi:hypothetical protein D3C71_2160330 [compost metagenome]
MLEQDVELEARVHQDLAVGQLVAFQRDWLLSQFFLQLETSGEVYDVVIHGGILGYFQNRWRTRRPST